MKIQKNKYKKYLLVVTALGIIFGCLIGDNVDVENRGELPVFHGSLESDCLKEEKSFQDCFSAQSFTQKEKLKASLLRIDAFFPELK